MFLSTVFTLFCLMASVPSRCVSESNDQLFSGRTPLHRARENYRKAPWGDPSSICLPAGESLLILAYLYVTFTYFYSYLLIRYLFYSYPFYPFLFMSHWLTPSFSLISIHDQLISNLILLHEKFLQFDWLRAVVFQLNLKYLHVKITNLLWVVV